MTATEQIRQGFYRSAAVRRFAQWLNVAPHPLIACEIAAGYIAAARWSRAGNSIECLAVEPLPPGAIKPNAVETNLANPAEVRSAMEKVFARLQAKTREVALFLPDPVIRVFVLHFDAFPRSASEALPLLRWRLKKSVPFETDETVVSFMRQAPREQGVDVVTALARLRIVREYEQLLEPIGHVSGRGHELHAGRPSPARRSHARAAGQGFRKSHDRGDRPRRNSLRLPLRGSPCR